jgi:hypothetical protein
VSEGAGEKIGGESDVPERDAGYWRTLGDKALVAALRAGEIEAVEEFIRRFEDLVMRYARWLRIPREDRIHWSGEVLYEAALSLGRGRAATPRQLAAYVTACCKYKARHQQALESSYRARVRAATEEVAGAGEYAAIAACSESSLRLARGAGWEAPPLSLVLQRLIAVFDEQLSANDRQLLSWLGQQVSYTTIASWSGISRPATVSRIQRLRARLTEVALQFGRSLSNADRAELLRFMRRSGAVDDDTIAALESRTKRTDDDA